MSTADDNLATALATAFAPEELDIIHGRMVDQLDDYTPLDDPFGRLIDAIFDAKQHRDETLGGAQ